MSAPRSNPSPGGEANDEPSAVPARPLGGGAPASRERATRDTRRALLDAGWRIFDRLGWDDLLRAIRVREVASEAGVTTGAFVHHFSTTERFHTALAEDARDRLLEEDARLFETLDRMGGVLEGIEASVDRDFHAPTLDVARRALLAMVVADDPQAPVGRMVQDLHARTDAALLARLRNWLRTMDREPLPPFTVADIAVTFRAVADGLRIRRAATPNAVDISLVGGVLLVLSEALTRPRPSAIELGDLRARLRHAPTRSGRRPRGWRTTIPTRRSPLGCSRWPARSSPSSGSTR